MFFHGSWFFFEAMLEQVARGGMGQKDGQDKRARHEKWLGATEIKEWIQRTAISCIKLSWRPRRT